MISARSLSTGLTYLFIACFAVACGRSVALHTPSPSPEPTTLVVPVEEARVVTADQATLRTGPGVSYEKAGSLSRGTEVMVIGKSANGDWYQLRLPGSGSEEAWLSAEFTAPFEPAQEEDASPAAASTLTSTNTVIVPTMTPSPPGSVTVNIPATTVVTPMPSIPMITATENTNCRAGTSRLFTVLANLAPGVSVEVRGRSPDGQWWYIQNPDRPDRSCWVWTSTTVVSGDISQIPVVQPPPLPTATLTLVSPDTPTYTYTPAAVFTPTLPPSATLAPIDNPTDTPTSTPSPPPSETLVPIDTPTGTSTSGPTEQPPMGTP